MAMLATGFVSDRADEGSIFPSAGGNSADAAVQAVYWRCIAVFFASARINNPHLRLALFSNVAPPEVDGVAVSRLLDRFEVEHRLLPLRTRLPRAMTPAWGNVLYFTDIFDSLVDEPADEPVALVDSDVVVTAPIDALFDRARSHDFVGYRVDSGPGEDINGMTPRQMAAAASELDVHPGRDSVPHYGGELLVARPAVWRARRALFRDLFERAMEGRGVAGLARTEEHFWSIAFATLGPGAVADANDLMKRIWTSPRYSTVARGDERLPIWHLPAEKRYGLRDLFRVIAGGRVSPAMNAGAFRSLAMRHCGVPRKNAVKVVRDGVGQVAAKLGVVR